VGKRWSVLAWLPVANPAPHAANGMLVAGTVGIATLACQRSTRIVLKGAVELANDRTNNVKSGSSPRLAYLLCFY